MLLGATPRELGLVAFIFGLIYGAQFVPKVGAWVGAWVADRKR